MDKMNCPICNKKIKIKQFSNWLEEWDESQWNSPEWRQFLKNEVKDLYETRHKLKELELRYEEQMKYLNTLEKQLELLQKTLDIAEKFSPRPLVIPGMSEVIK